MENSESKMKAGIIGACWYLKPDRFEKMADHFARSVLGEAVFDNKIWISMRGNLDVPAGDSWRCREGDFLDISAYAIAANEVPSNLPLYLVFNDTLFLHHPRKLIAHNLSALSHSISAAKAPSVAGNVHPSTDLLLVDAQNITRSHISTFCILMNARAFDVFRRLLSDLPINSSFESIQSWLDEHVASYPALGPLLHVHLLGPDTPWSWSSRKFAIRDSTLLLRKAVTVVFEYLFTIELLKIGFAMPINCDIGYKIRSRLGRFG